MSDPNDKKHDPRKEANNPQHREAPKGPYSPLADKGTGTLPGMPERDERGRQQGHEGRRAEQGDPNPGPGITSQGQRVDGDAPAEGDEREKKRTLPGQEQHTDPKEKPRDRDKDRKEPLDKHRVGDAPAEHTTRAKDQP